jgi:hypothetical protein
VKTDLTKWLRLKILTAEIEAKIQHDIIENVLQQKFDLAVGHLLDILQELYANIPEGKRISFGRVYTIQVLSSYLFSSLVKANAPVFEIGSTMFKRSNDSRAKGVSLGILSLCGIENREKVLPFFKSSASSPDWNMREYAQMFFRRLIREKPRETKEFLLKLARSRDPNIRRFVS